MLTTNRVHLHEDVTYTKTDTFPEQKGPTPAANVSSRRRPAVKIPIEIAKFLLSGLRGIILCRFEIDSDDAINRNGMQINKKLQTDDLEQPDSSKHKNTITLTL
jgi:hypothetical protein